ncbi:MAG: phosphate acyltransferase PlsX [bacterium JZ-2024 1]
MRIALDAMGGDFAPSEIVRGALIASDVGVKVLLVGPQDDLKKELANAGRGNVRHIEVIDTPEVVGMADDPMEVLRHKPDASIARVARMVAEGDADAAISAGNSGAFFAACLKYLRMKGVAVPCFGALLPSMRGKVILVDAGANVNCQPRHLVEFATMADSYMSAVEGIEHPRIGLVNVGGEEGKGNYLVKRAYGLLRNTHLNFAGNVEGREFFAGRYDVLVCDGFTGNVVLKAMEGVGSALKRIILRELPKNKLLKAPLLLYYPMFLRISRKLDYHEYGGAPVLGVKGVCVVGHGTAKARTIRATLRQAAEMVKVRLPDQLQEKLHEERRRNPWPLLG